MNRARNRTAIAAVAAAASLALSLPTAVGASTIIHNRLIASRRSLRAATRGTKPTIALVSAEGSITYYTTMNCGAMAAAKKQGVNYIYEAPKDFSAAEQEPIIQALLAKKISALAVVPAATTTLNGLLTSVAKQMPLITTDLNTSVKVGLANIQSNGYDGGLLAAKRMAALLKGKTGDVLYIDNAPTVAADVVRGAGFAAGMKKYAPGIKMLPVEYAGGDPSGAETIVNNTLISHPDLLGIFATYEPSVLGAVSALAGQSAAVREKIKVIGYDADTSEVQDLKRGVVDSLVIQQPYVMGYDAITELAEVLRGTLKPSHIKYYQETELVLATKANMNDPSVHKFFYVSSCKGS